MLHKTNAITDLEERSKPLFAHVNNNYLFTHHHLLFKKKEALYEKYNQPINHTEIASIMDQRAGIKEQLDNLPKNPEYYNKEALIKAFKEDSDVFFIKANEALKNRTVYV